MSDESSERRAGGPARNEPAPAQTPSSRAPRSGIRASDAEREQLISELNDHMVAGRIGTDELEERTQAAYQARTTAELDALRHDLPPTPRQVARYQKQRRAHLTRRMIQQTGGLGAVFVLCTVVWVSDGAQTSNFWPAWVLLLVVLSVARNAWALYGPAPDLDAVERDLDRRRGQHRGGDRRHRHRDL